MRFAITGTDARFLPLRKLLLADGHEITDPASADMVISPPWDPSARYARRERSPRANRIHAAPIIGQHQIKMLHVADQIAIARRPRLAMKRRRCVARKFDTHPRINGIARTQRIGNG